MTYDPLKNARMAVEGDLQPAWLERASDLLAEPDPGPTPWLIDELIVDQAIVAIVGKWKTTKTYALLDAAISVVTGTPFLQRHEVANPGPVIVVLEESGRKALWRRLDSLSRGRAIDRDALGDLHYAANQRVKLDDLEWQQALLDAGTAIRPRLIIFDPLARLKRPGLDESAQKEYAILIEFMRHLREETGAAVAFVQHTGHTGDHMRGTSDLESVWESRLAFRRDQGTISIVSEHREAEAGAATSYQLDWDETTRTIRLRGLTDTTEEKVVGYLREHPDASANDVYDHIGGNRVKVLAAVKVVRERLSQSGSDSRNHPGTTPSDLPSAGGSPDPPFRGAGTTAPAGAAEVVPASGTGLGDDGFEWVLLEAVQNGHITDAEASERLELHRLVVRSEALE